MIREQRGWILKSRVAGHLRSDVLSVEDIERLSGSKELGGKPSSLGGRKQEVPRPGLDQWSRSCRQVAWNVRRSYVVGDLDLPC